MNPSLTTSQLVTVNLRNQGCGMLILVDDTVSIKLFQNNETVIRNKVDTYISKLNEIYQRTILKDPPNNNIYFFTEHLTLLRNYLPNCQNKGVNDNYRHVSVRSHILLLGATEFHIQGWRDS